VDILHLAAPCRYVPVTFALDLTMRPMLSSKYMIVAACCFLALAAQAQSSQAALDCSIGPANRSYGGVPWLVYACSDNATVVLVSAPGSPAAPFYFTFFRKNGRYSLGGEGTGARSVTDRAYSDLSALSEPEVKGLLASAKAAATSKVGK
jgi:hypothetical protein